MVNNKSLFWAFSQLLSDCNFTFIHSITKILLADRKLWPHTIAISLGKCMGNPRVSRRLPVPEPVGTRIRYPTGLPAKTSPKTWKTVEKWVRYTQFQWFSQNWAYLIQFSTKKHVLGLVLKVAGRKIVTRTHTRRYPYLWPMRVRKTRAFPYISSPCQKNGNDNPTGTYLAYVDYHHTAKVPTRKPMWIISNCNHTTCTYLRLDPSPQTWCWNPNLNATTATNTGWTPIHPQLLVPP